jgi:GT2 family glycosyltransferase
VILSTEQTNPRVAVIILTWNRVDELVPCLTSFEKNDYPATDVVVIDNGSEDETAATTKRDFPWVKLIENGKNLGFCRGNNVGLRYALEQGYPYIMLLNSDTEYVPGLIRELVSTMEADPKIGIAGAKNLLMENPDYTWGKYGVVTWGPMLVRTVGRFAPDDRQNAAPMDVPWVIGNACMMRREALVDVGLFDEEFWQCNEDVDWCYRCREAGFRVVYVDRAAILHKGGSSADVTQKKVFSYGYFIGRNAWTFARKHGNVLRKIQLFTMMTIGMLGRIAFFSLDASKNAILGQRAFVCGMLDGMRGRLRTELITVAIPEGGRRRFRQGIRGRLMRWIGV